jgi:hypothetical protein
LGIDSEAHDENLKEDSFTTQLHCGAAAPDRGWHPAGVRGELSAIRIDVRSKTYKLRSVNDESIRSPSHYILPLDRSDSYYIKPV